ncbi:MAG: guanylate kinase [Desulfobacterales bacterium]|nr:guanylate kinase [Desulfobacterales bacterium]
MPGQLFVISGPSGAGKSTIVNALSDRTDGLVYSISHTSRRPRGREKSGIEYHFVDPGTFNRMIEAGAFVEWAKVYDDFYGTSFSSIEGQTGSGVDVLLDVDSQGARNIRKHFEDSVLIYVLPPSLEILKKRLKGRGTDDEGVIKVRMEKALNDIDNCLWYDYIIINDDLEKAITEAKSIIIAKRCRTARQANVQTLLETFRK